MSSASVWAIGIQFIFAPILSRIYAPEVYGLFSVYGVVLAFGSTLITMGFGRALVLPRDDHSMAALLRLSLLSAAAAGALFTVGFALFGNTLATWLSIAEAGNWLRLAGLFSVILAFEQLVGAWGVQQKAFRKLTAVSVPLSLISKLFNTGYGVLISSGVSGLIITSVLLSLGRVFAVGGWALKRVKPLLNAQVSTAQLRATLSEYRDYPLFMVWSTLLNQISNFTPALVLPFFMDGTREIGLFSYAMMLLELPSRVLGTGITNTYLQQTNTDWHEKREEVSRRSARLLLYLSGLALVTALVVYFAAPLLFGVVFGRSWTEAGTVAGLLAAGYGLRYISIPFSSVFLIARKEPLQLMLQVALFGLRMGGLVIPGMMGLGFSAMLIGYSVANIIAHGAQVVLAFYFIGTHVQRSAAIAVGFATLGAGMLYLG